MKRACIYCLMMAFAALANPAGWAQGAQPGAHHGQIRGQVRLANDQPGPFNLVVNLEYVDGGFAAQTQTDRRGRFEFTMVSPARYIVRVHAPGYQVEAQDVDLLSIPTAYLTFVLKQERGADNSGVPPEGPAATVVLLDPNAPEDARKSLEDGKNLLTQGKDLDKSITFFQKAISQYPQFSEAYFLMGAAYSYQKKWDEAAKSLGKSIELNQHNPAAYVALGSVENESKNYAEAEKHLLKAVELSPESADAHFELGRTYWGLSRWDAADQHVGKANQLRPDNWGQHVLMGNILLRERNAQGALKEFREALKIDSKGPRAEPVRQMVDRIEQALKAQNQSQ
jgi:Flp pilus assembly protein TadD